EFDFVRDPLLAHADEEDFEPVPPPATAPTRNGIGNSRSRKDVPPAPEPAEPAPPRRHLMFASSSRRERERTQARPPHAPVSAPPLAPADEPSQAPYYDEPWPKPERLRLPELPSQRRGGRMPPAFNEPNTGPAARNSDQQTATVLKSGVVDGMAY